MDIPGIQIAFKTAPVNTGSYTKPLNLFETLRQG